MAVRLSKREIELVLELCHQVDCLVTQDPGASNLEVLEKYRFKMNDYLWNKRYREAENVAYAILAMHSGVSAERYLKEEFGS